MNPWLSVIVPVYNGERYLAEALESVAGQADDDIEVIAVDDGSSDSSVDILRSYEGRLPLRICRPGRSGNWVAATNRGLALARGTYVSMLHQDDLWHPGRLQHIRNLLERGTRPELIVSDARFIDADGIPLGVWRCPLRPDTELGREEVVAKLLVQNFIALPAALFNREAALRCGGLDERLWYSADWDLWLKLAGSGSTRYLPMSLASFRVHGQSQTATRSDSSDELRNQLETVLTRHLVPWIQARAPGREADEVTHAAWFSVKANVAAAAWSHGSARESLCLVRGLVALGTRGFRRYVRDSRIGERLGARVRARLRAKRLPKGIPGRRSAEGMSVS
jgi:GT2 family glycosyltransferase